MKYKGKISDPLDLVTKQWTESAISTAKSEAISDAKSYADTKTSEAISTASSDATTKANNALTSAKAYTDSAITAAINATY